jgi:hypothetical protein
MGDVSAIVAVETVAGSSATVVLPIAIEIAIQAAASASSSLWERVVSGVRICLGVSRAPPGRRVMYRC